MNLFKKTIGELRLHILSISLIFIINSILVFLKLDFLYYILIQPLQRNTKAELIYTNVIDKFSTDINVVFSSAFLLLIPFATIILYNFIRKGLYPKEKAVLRKILIVSVIIFFTGLLLCYRIIFPNMLNFLVTGSDMIKPMIKIDDYVNLFFQMHIIFGLILQFPIILHILITLKAVSIKTLKKIRRQIIVLIFIISAIITPPDIASQIFCAIIMICMYELVILFNNGRDKK